MKKTLPLLLLSFLLFIFSCTQDDVNDSRTEERKENLILHKNASFIEKNNELNAILNHLNSVKQSRSVNDSLDKINFKVYKDNITYIKTPDGERESFTFFVEKNYKRNLNFVENLVLSKRKDSDQFEAVLITYYFPDGYKVENKDFQVIETVPIPDIEKFDLFNKNGNKSARSSGCQVDLVETKHSCYSGHHSGAGEAAQCDHKGQGPYSTFTLYLSCSGSGGGGGGQESSPGGNNGPQTGNGGSGGNNGNSGANNGIDTGITLPPSCQGTECNEVVLPNNINALLDKKLSFSELVFLYNNESIASEIYTALTNNQQYNRETYLWAISYLTNNIDAGFYFSQNPKDLEVLYALGVDFFSQNPNISWDHLENWFFKKQLETENHPVINPDLITFDAPIQQASLPSFNTFLSNFPKKGSAPNYIELPTSEVYKLAGGSLWDSHLNQREAYNNACAIRGSRGLLYSGFDIPVLRYNGVQRTQKGGDNKNYIIRRSIFQ